MEEKKSWKQDLLDEFCEELDGAEKYAEYSLNAKTEGNIWLATGLWQISYDEYTHARFIRSEMIASHHYNPEHYPEKEKRFHKIASMFS